MTPYRVLVTSSSDWVDALVLWRALLDVLDRVAPRHLVVVHGACPTGGDQLADDWVTWVDDLRPGLVSRERHPAEWRPSGTYDPAAGFRRNAAMVQAGADLCLAALMPCSRQSCRRAGPHDSHGATHCLGLAVASGIPHDVLRSSKNP